MGLDVIVGHLEVRDELGKRQKKRAQRRILRSLVRERFLDLHVLREARVKLPERPIDSRAHLELEISGDRAGKRRRVRQQDRKQVQLWAKQRIGPRLDE